jgi:hypothetical protein
LITVQTSIQIGLDQSCIITTHSTARPARLSKVTTSFLVFGCVYFRLDLYNMMHTLQPVVCLANQRQSIHQHRPVSASRVSGTPSQ